MNCQYAKSDMTPCYRKDAVLALFDKGDVLTVYCVGCEHRVYPTNAELIDYAKIKGAYEAAKRKPKKRRWRRALGDG